MGTPDIPTRQAFDEVYLVQNPALGAVLLWKFVEGYQAPKPSAQPLLPLLFIVLPIIFTEQLRLQLSSTYPSSGLRLFVAKFAKDQEEILAIQKKMLLLRETSLSSLSIAISCGFLTLEHTTARVSANSRRFPSGVADEMKALVKHAGKLGAWCSSLSLQEVQAALRIAF